jgi:hypothetical protein
VAQQFIIVNEHDAADCEPMEAGIPKIPAQWKGTKFYCTCPSGTHGYFMIVEGDSVEHVTELLPAEVQMGSTKVLPIEALEL